MCNYRRTLHYCRHPGPWVLFGPPCPLSPAGTLESRPLPPHLLALPPSQAQRFGPTLPKFKRPLDIINLAEAKKRVGRKCAEEKERGVGGRGMDGEGTPEREEEGEMREGAECVGCAEREVREVGEGEGVVSVRREDLVIVAADTTTITTPDSTTTPPCPSALYHHTHFTPTPHRNCPSCHQELTTPRPDTNPTTNITTLSNISHLYPHPYHTRTRTHRQRFYRETHLDRSLQSFVRRKRRVQVLRRWCNWERVRGARWEGLAEIQGEVERGRKWVEEKKKAVLEVERRVEKGIVLQSSRSGGGSGNSAAGSTANTDPKKYDLKTGNVIATKEQRVRVRKTAVQEERLRNSVFWEGWGRHGAVVVTSTNTKTTTTAATNGAISRKRGNNEMEEDDKDGDATEPGKKRVRAALEQFVGNTPTLPAPAPALAPPPSPPLPSQSHPKFPTSSSSSTSFFPSNHQPTTTGTSEPSLTGASSTPAVSHKSPRQTRKRSAPNDATSPTTATKRLKTTGVANTIKTTAAKKYGTTAGRFAIHSDEVGAPYELEYPETSRVERDSDGDGYHTYHIPSTQPTHPQTQTGTLNHHNHHKHSSFANGNGNGNGDNNNHHHNHHHGGYGYGYQSSSIPPLYPQFLQQFSPQQNFTPPNLNSDGVDPNTTTNSHAPALNLCLDPCSDEEMSYTRMLMGGLALRNHDDDGHERDRVNDGEGEGHRYGHGRGAG